MSRLSSPAGHRAPPAGAAVRNGMTAAAAAGVALAVSGPLMPTPEAGATVLRLADDAPAPDIRLVASVVPVAGDELPPEGTVDGLVKAAGLADTARQIEEQRAAREAQASCDPPLGGLGRVKPGVRDAARFLSCLYDRPTLIGVASRSRVSDHPRGLAVDFMVGTEQGDRIAECALANKDELGISYVLWRQRANYGDGWSRMSDRGGDTENHYDHVHISFNSGGGSGAPLVARCS